MAEHAQNKVKSIQSGEVVGELIDLELGHSGISLLRITADMVKPGAVVIDVGMNRNQAGKLCGDVDFESVSRVAGYLTPVPGGVGPMTITMLLRSTVLSAQNRRKKQ